jgi:hypothetical protein
VAVAPAAPGRLGESAPLDALRGYLGALDDWRAGRKAELDRLDEAALRATDPAAYTGDVTLSMALWQAVSDRYEQLMAAWDSGRADRMARERMSQLIWGRLDAGLAGPAPAGSGLLAAGLSVSLVDACRLSDALAAQLRARLSFDPSAADAAARVAALRGAMGRLRELVKHEQAAVGQVQRLVARVEDLAGVAARGGEVTRPLQVLEADAARAERDLIITTATRRQRDRERDRAAADLGRDRVLAMNEVAALEHRAPVLRTLADQCARKIAAAPRLAVPDAAALGPVPADRARLDAYLRRLADVARAMDLVEHAYGAPLAELAELNGRLDGYRVMAARTGRDAEPEVRQAAQVARASLQAVPCDLDAARRLVTRYSQLVRATPPAAGATP